ncbi:DUF4282 domain-containing protein [Candidatus Cryosericum terrychapinii]|jgi:hypothetical protein|nr:DUF4282 domain-containing protein [Candidatus Cryosericum terrychapinii]
MDNPNGPYTQEPAPAPVQGGGQPQPQYQYQPPTVQQVSSQSWWGGFINFKTLVMFSVIKWLYILGAVVITLAGLTSMFSRVFRLFGGFWAGLAILILGNLSWRLTCETIIVLFRIAQGVTSIDSKTH